MMDDYRAGIAETIPLEAVEFFAVFSRLEFALKRGGFLAGAMGGRADVNWVKLADVLGSAFYDRLRNDPMTQVFFEAPPKRLVVLSHDQVAFSAAAPISNLQMLLESVRLVRNNLFHGEKLLVSERDRRLIRAALRVIDSVLAELGSRPETNKVTSAFTFASVEVQ